MRLIVTVAILLIVGREALLGEQSRQYDKCISKAVTQLAMNICAKEEFLRVDEELSQFYNRLMSVVGDESSAIGKIKAAKESWAVYRNALIDAIFFAKDKQSAYGSSFPMEVDLLRAKLTRQQLEIMKETLRRYGDMPE